MKSKVEVAAEKYFRNMAVDFVPFLGEVDPDVNEITFSAPLISMKCVVLKKVKNAHLFGGFFSLAVVGNFDNPGIEITKPIAIGYKGKMIRGDAYFTCKSSETNTVADLLNANQDLIRKLSDFDLERGVVTVNESSITVSLIPLGISYMYVTFPPMQYSSTFHKGDIDKVCSSLDLIGKTLTTSATTI